jgi:hypothetical protein
MRLICRQVKIKNHGTFAVPPHIQRIEKFEPGHIGTRGWQVRYRKPWKLFSDYAHGRNGPDESLKDAIDYLRRIYKGPTPVVFKQRMRTARSSLPVGLSEVIIKRKDRKVREIRIQVSIPNGVNARHTTKRIYVGTENTITRKRYREAVRRAVALRKQCYQKYWAACRRLRLDDTRGLRKRP